jgi:hypothetical protein
LAQARPLLPAPGAPPVPAVLQEEEEVVVPGIRYTVFCIRKKDSGSIWVRAGVAFVQPDDSMNLFLDVLPIEGHLHIRQTGNKSSALSSKVSVSNNDNNRGQPATPALADQQAMGGH